MKLAFPWFGEKDTVCLKHVGYMRGARGVASALHSVPDGELWPEEELLRMKKTIEDAGLAFEVAENLPVHEDIKLRRGDFARYIDNYKENIAGLARAGIKYICYNFTPMFSHSRALLARELLESLRDSIEACGSEAQWRVAGARQETVDSPFKPEETIAMTDAYIDLGKEGLWTNLELFVNEIIPTASRYGVNMAMLPDDPARGIKGVPLAVATEDDVDRFLALSGENCHGLTMSSGGLCGEISRYERLIHKYVAMGRVHFAYLRDMKIRDDGSLAENAHCSPYDSLGMARILDAYNESGYEGWARFDHSRMVCVGQDCGLYDRFVGTMYITSVMLRLNQRIQMLASAGK
ncbi:MAG: mannonate dehydratase [Synergistaceae bacterium]|jgi:mannonate dehydratase|nr:mannonate dehydratase [Synergistaceae bacterium]